MASITFSSHTKPKVLVTGGTGFVGSHVVYQLLTTGYPVRGTCRSAKLDEFKQTFAKFSDLFEAFEVDDLVTGDFSQAVQGINAIIHVAALVPKPGATRDDIYKCAVTGTTRILSAGIQAGVKKIVVTADVGNVHNLIAHPTTGSDDFFEDKVYNETTWRELSTVDWNNVDLDFAYFASKSIAEREVWGLAGKNPGVDFTTILPPTVHGPYVPDFPKPRARSELGSPIFIYNLFADGPDQHAPLWQVSAQANVKDVARAHVLALSVPPHPDGVRKRLIVYNGNMFWEDAVQYLKEVRPQISSRLLRPEIVKSVQMTTAKYDRSFTDKVLGLTEVDYTPWQQTLVETVDQLIEWESSRV